MAKTPTTPASRRARLHEIIFEAETPAGKVFDVTLLIAIVLSVVAVSLESVADLVEGTDNGFTSIPQSVYWAIVTMTTVGYGDIAPQTVFGKVLASAVMILGYGIIAVPTGIVTVEIAGALKDSTRTEACTECGAEDHAVDAAFCKYCGTRL